jgi:type I restriction enzyme M protein
MLPEFKKRIDTLRDILVGAVPSPAGQIEQITYALIYKFMSDIDDRSASIGGKRTYFTGEYEKFGWHELMAPTLGAHDRLTLYREALANLAKNPGLPELFQGIYQNAYLTFNDPRVLTLFLKEIDNFKHSSSDDIGDAYEYLLQITGAQGDVGQFRTPRHIIKFIVEAVNPTKSDSVLDPAVGTAGFLIAAYNHVKHHHDGVDDITGLPNDKEVRLSADELDKLHKNYHGFDIDPTMVRTAKVNMYLHGFTTPDIKNHDSLSSEDWWNERYDVILANPPFMSPKGGIKPHDKFGIKANRAEVLFVDYIASHLKPTGRAGIVVPEGVIFQSGNAYKELRKNLVDNYLYAVVSLPAGVFQPYSGVKTSILLLDKELAKQRDAVLFVQIENDGYSLGTQRRETIGSQFPEALKLIKSFRAGETINSEFASSVTRSQIADSGDYNLNGDRYKTNELHLNHEWEVAELGDVVEILDRLRKPITKSDRKSGEFPYYGATGILDHVEDYIFNERLVLLGEDGAKWQAGEKSAFIAEGKYWVNNHAHVLRPLPAKILDVYLVNILNQMDLMPYITGVTVPKLNQEKMRGIKIPLPSIEIQREIVAELDNYQRIIDAAQTIVKTYKPTIKISSEWKTDNLKGICKLIGGYAFKSSDLKNDTAEGYLPVIKIGNVSKSGELNLSNTQYHKYSDSLKNFIINQGDILIAMTGATVGKVAVAQQGSMLLNQRVGLIRATGVDQQYLQLTLMSDDFYNFCQRTAGGGAQGNISPDQISTYEIYFPSFEEQKRIVAQLESEQSLIDANKKLIDIYTQKIKAKIAEVWGE